MQDGRVRQRLHRRYQDESREVEIGNVDFATMGLEITSKKRASVSHDGIDIVELPGAGNLLVQDAVKPRIDAVSLDRGRDEFAHRDVDRA